MSDDGSYIERKYAEQFGLSVGAVRILRAKADALAAQAAYRKLRAESSDEDFEQAMDFAQVLVSAFNAEW